MLCKNIKKTAGPKDWGGEWSLIYYTRKQNKIRNEVISFIRKTNRINDIIKQENKNKVIQLNRKTKENKSFNSIGKQTK